MDDLAAFKTGYDGMLLHLSVSEMQVRQANSAASWLAHAIQ